MPDMYRSYLTRLLSAWLLTIIAFASWSPAYADSAPGDEIAKYKVRFESGLNPDLEKLFRSVSKLVALDAVPPLTLNRLRRRATEDIERFVKALRSEGYYSGQARFHIDERDGKVTVVLTVAPGEAYLLKSFDFSYVDDGGATEGLPATATELGLVLGNRARAPVIVQAERQFITILAEKGRPFAKRLDRTVIVDHADHSLTVALAIEPGPPAVFGETQFEGLRGVKEAYVRRFIPWKPGEKFDTRQLEKLRELLSKTRLFRSVILDYPKTPTGQTGVPVTVKMAEAKMRTYEFGAKWGSGEGFGGEASWEHRNIFGRGERLKIAGEAAEIRQGLDVTLRKPNFHRLDQTLRLGVTAERENNKAFEEITGALQGSIERRLSPTWVASAGASAEVSKVTDTDDKDTFMILGLPLSTKWDTSNDLLNPTRGMRIDLDLTPHISISGTTRFFLVSEASASAYKSFFNDYLVFAGRIAAGSIVGTASDNIPANKRFYAGGGGSIRGFGYKLVGPLDALGDPVGGRSFFEIGGEARIKISRTIGIVPFIEGGNVYDAVYPDFSSNLRWAAGIGARYYTAIGPIRLDFAFPLNRRPGIDDRFQFYISLGQAF